MQVYFGSLTGLSALFVSYMLRAGWLGGDSVNPYFAPENTPENTPERTSEANFEKGTCMNFMFQKDLQY